MAKHIRKKEKPQNNFQKVMALLAAVFVLAVLCVMPLIYTDYYFNMLETKYLTYCTLAIGTIVLMAAYGLYSGRIPGFLKAVDVKKIIKSLNPVDWSMLVFWLFNVLSWVFCFDWRYEAFWGTSGRYNGVFLMTLYMIIYFLITRFFHFRQWYLDVFLAIGILVCVFGITDYFQMDILHFKAEMLDEQKESYCSTFGNINTYTIYVGALVVVSTILFALEKNWKRALWYYGNLVLSMIALIMGESDNAYLTLAALFGFSPLLLFRTGTGLRRYLISLSTFLTAIWYVAKINVDYADVVLKIQGLFNLISQLEFLPKLIGGMWTLTAVAAVLTFTKPADRFFEKFGKWFSCLWLFAIAAVVALVVYILYDANIAGNTEPYQAISKYVIFNDDWGSHRGYAWIKAMEIYKTKFNTLQRIFGYGADTFKLLMAYYYGGRVDRYGQTIYFDSVHNEYLNYLITIGPIGMMAYISYLCTAVGRMAKSLRDRPEVAAVMFAVLGYMVQATVNINIPIATPIILTLLAMGLSRKGERGA